MPSFDTVIEPNLVEVRNAVDQCAKEIGTRFDFKGSSAAVELADKSITLFADSRITSSVLSVGMANVRPSSRCRIAWPAAQPSSKAGWRTVVSGGVVYAEPSRSSKPTSETSSGTRMPRR